MTSWIKIEENCELPLAGETVLVYAKPTHYNEFFVTLAILRNNLISGQLTWDICVDLDWETWEPFSVVTHYQKLPKGPTQE